MYNRSIFLSIILKATSYINDAIIIDKQSLMIKYYGTLSRYNGSMRMP